MKNLTKKEIVENIAASTGVTQVDSMIVLEGFFEAVKESLREGRNVEIRGFGRFKTRKAAARKARNPRTGAPAKVREHIRPVFEVSQELKALVNLKGGRD